MIRAPSDLAHLPASELGPSSTVKVGGRVRRVSPRGAAGEGFPATLVLVDSFCALEVACAFPASSELEGAHVVLRGVYVGGSAARLVDAELVATHAGAPNRDVARFGGPVGQALALRQRATRTARAVFKERGFIEVDTPTLVPCPGLDSHLDAFEVVGAERASGSGERARQFLATSPEYQMKRLLVGGVPRCFQLGRAYREGEVGGRHNPEFTMLEWYRAFGTMEDVMADTEELVRATVRACAPASSSLHQDVPAGSFERLRVKDAFREYAGVDEARMLALAHEDEPRFFEILAFEVEPAIARAPHPVFLTHYPRPMASLARLDPDDPRYALRFELYLRGVELCNGFDELTDPHEQRARFERDRDDRRAAGRVAYPLDERFLDALVEGMPPSAGNALGFDRLLMVALERPTIEDVLAFPHAEL